MSDTQTIYLGVNDDIAAVVDHLTAADVGKVFFVVPKDAEIFSSIVNLKLLKREAASQNKVITLVTSDKMGRYLAQRAEIPFQDEAEHVEQLPKVQVKKAPVKSAEEKIILEEKPVTKERVIFPEEKKMVPPKSMADIVVLPKAAQHEHIPVVTAEAALSSFREEKILPRIRSEGSYKRRKHRHRMKKQRHILNSQKRICMPKKKRAALRHPPRKQNRLSPPLLLPNSMFQFITLKKFCLSRRRGQCLIRRLLNTIRAPLKV